jgi:hypothetical protein
MEIHWFGLSIFPDQIVMEHTTIVVRPAEGKTGYAGNAKGIQQKLVRVAS